MGLSRRAASLEYWLCYQQETQLKVVKKSNLEENSTRITNPYSDHIV